MDFYTLARVLKRISIGDTNWSVPNHLTKQIKGIQSHNYTCLSVRSALLEVVGRDTKEMDDKLMLALCPSLSLSHTFFF